MQNTFNWLSGKKTYLACALGGALMFGSWQKWWTLPPEIYAGLMAFALAFLRNAVAKVETQMSATAGPSPDGGSPAPAPAPQPAPSTASAPAPANRASRAVMQLGLTRLIRRAQSLPAACLPLAILGACALAAVWLVGCAAPQLAPGGPYSSLGASGSWLYALDTTVSESYLALDGFESWELTNHPYLATNSPSVEAVAGTIRTNAPRCFQDYTLARAALLTLLGGTNAPALLATASNQVQVAFTCITNLVGTASAATNGTAIPK